VVENVHNNTLLAPFLRCIRVLQWRIPLRLTGMLDHVSDNPAAEMEMEFVGTGPVPA